METKSTFSQAAYFTQGEVLARVGVRNEDEVSFSYQEPPDAYIRLIPMTALERPLPLAQLREAAKEAPLLKLRPGHLVDINQYGVIAYEPTPSRGGPAPLDWATQLFRNGELWAMSNRMIVRPRVDRPDWPPTPILPAFVFEHLFYRTLHESISFGIKHLRLDFPYRVELGILNTRGMQIGITNADLRGPAQKNGAFCLAVLSNAERATIDDTLLEFSKEVHDLSGYRRPEGLYGFPPGPPRP